MRARRYLSLALVGVLALGVCSCKKEAQEPSVPEEVTPADGNSPKVMVVKAGSPETKTTIEIVEEDKVKHYHSKWVSGDRIQVLEVIYDNYGSDGFASYYTSVPLEGKGQTFDTANFSVTLDAGHTGGDYHYIGVYPPYALVGTIGWSGENEVAWANNWGVGVGLIPAHITLELEIPNHQSPSADCFDTNADVLVSQMVTVAEQPASMSLHFARVGTIVCITLKNLPAGERVKEGRFSFGDSWTGIYRFEYDPVLQKRGVFEKSTGFIDFAPSEVYVDGDGHAQIWLRTLSGTLTDYFSLSVTTNDGKDDHFWEKSVNLADLKREMVFAEGGVTTFGVNLETAYHVTATADISDVTESSANIGLTYDLGGMPYSTAVYGAIVSDDFGHIADPTTALPAEKHVLANPADPLNLTELSPATTYYVLPYVVLDDVPNYGTDAFFTTLTHYDYATPSLVDLGLPSGTKWASFNLGATAPEQEGYYYAFGETYPQAPASSVNKYWAYYDRATKYSTSALRGDVVDLLTVLDASDDAATVNLGGSWRTPTRYDVEELLAHTTATSESGGMRYTSTVSGYESNSIFLPSCQFYDGSHSGLQSDHDYYMTASLSATTQGNPGRNPENFNGIWLWASDTHTVSPIDWHSRRYGLNIRPVSGGTRQGLVYTCHPVAPLDITSSSACIRGIFTNDEEEGHTYTYYVILYQEGATDWYKHGTPGRTESYTFTGLSSNTTYYYSVGWWDNYGNCQESEIRSFTTMP